MRGGALRKTSADISWRFDYCRLSGHLCAPQDRSCSPFIHLVCCKKWLFEIWARPRNDVNRAEAIKLTDSIEEASVRDHTKSQLALSLAENPRTAAHRTLIAKIMEPR